MDDIEAMLVSMEKSQNVASSTSNLSRENPGGIIRPLLLELGREERLKKDRNILEYWKQQALKKPQLFELSKVALAVPATQVSVEKLFSGLKFLIGHLRCSLKDDVIDAISLIRSNHICGLKFSDMM